MEVRETIQRHSATFQMKDDKGLGSDNGRGNGEESGFQRPSQGMFEGNR